MEPPAKLLRIGAWCVNPTSGEMSKDGESIRLEARAMRLLLHLAEHAGVVISIDDLLTHVWSGLTVTQDSVYQAVASLRRQLGDDPRQPTYIATVPRLGYRMVAKVGPWTEPVPASSHSPHFKWTATALVLLLAAAGFLFYGKAANNNHTVAVLPFLDLTDQMSHEIFADGVTEELIDKLSKIPGLKVPSPTSSFYFKGKNMPIADIAKSLGVAYVLDGSVRKSGSRIRIDARLIRADNGYIVWSETYDRPSKDLLWVQDDIAAEVAKGLKLSFEAKN